MKKLSKILCSLGLLCSSFTVSANTTDLTTCLVDHLNGKERKNLAVWVFMAMAAHPEITGYTTLTDEAKESMDKNIGTLITRLLTDDCPKELMSANKQDPQALKNSFEVVGKVAMQELMTNQSVSAALTNYIKYANQQKIGALLQQ
ncbi:hypothetical protein [Neptunicella marina]|uniref:Uncharacterized protein n=1 Tax=Neptunicella marina TaxID=2125989 RepID=A0A8J6IWB6_9ALTE|nr:hypothetical protein [Neptunicella marina]MBC3766997.1 hypothetical protein [Neptunicella marina]